MEDKKYLVYQIYNKVENKSYIGSTCDLEGRIKQHKRGKKEWQIIFHDYPEIWTINILEDNININTIPERELYYIKLYDSVNNGYNSSYKVTRYVHTEYTRKKMSESNNGHIVLEETRKKISESKQGKNLSTETKRKLSIALKKYYETHEAYNKGNKLSEETKRKISEKQKGKCLTKEHIKILSEVNKGRHLSEETRKKISEARKKYWEVNKCRHLSEETKKKMSEARKKYWDNKRNGQQSIYT